MLEVNTKTDRDCMTIFLKGRLDSNSIYDFSREIPLLDNITKVTLDFSELGYISSAGLRVLLSLQRKMDKNNGELLIKHPNDSVIEIFDVTGFLDVFSVEMDD